MRFANDGFFQTELEVEPNLADRHKLSFRMYEDNAPRVSSR